MFKGICRFAVTQLPVPSVNREFSVRPGELHVIVICCSSRDEGK